MLIDFIALALLLLALFKGFRKGLIVAVFSFLALLIGLAAALKLSAIAAEFIGQTASLSQKWLPVLAFLAVFITVVFLVRIGAKMIEGLAKIAMLGWLNRLGGIFFYLLIYFSVFSVVLFYAVQLHVLKPAATQSSASYPFISALGPKMMDAMSFVFPFLKNIFSELLNFFQNISDNHQQASLFAHRLIGALQ